MRLTHGIMHELEEAFNYSTISNNIFERAIRILERKLGPAIEADGELYFVFEDAIFTTPGTDPFDMPWKPSVTWRDCGKTYEF